MDRMREKGLILALIPFLFLLMVMMPGCQKKSGKQAGERTVVVYTSVDQPYADPLLKEFENKTGIKVLPVFDVEATKTTGLVNRLIAEKANPQCDVFWNNEFAQTLVLKERGVLAAYRSAAAGGIPPQFVDPEGCWTGLAGRARVILVNTRLVPPAQYPRSIYDLLDNRFKGEQVAMAYPLFGTTATQAAAVYALEGRQKGRQYYERLHARGVRVVDGNSVVRDLVADGQARVGLTDSDDANGAVRDGKPVAIIYPDQDTAGTLIIPGTVALIANAPHQAEARALIDYLLSVDVEKKLIASGFCQIPLRPAEVKAEGVPAAGIKGMAAGFHEIYSRMNEVQTDLAEIFVR